MFTFAILGLGFEYQANVRNICQKKKTTFTVTAEVVYYKNILMAKFALKEGHSTLNKKLVTQLKTGNYICLQASSAVLHSSS